MWTHAYWSELSHPSVNTAANPVVGHDYGAALAVGLMLALGGCSSMLPAHPWTSKLETFGLELAHPLGTRDSSSIPEP